MIFFIDIELGQLIQVHQKHRSKKIGRFVLLVMSVYKAKKSDT